MASISQQREYARKLQPSSFPASTVPQSGGFKKTDFRAETHLFVFDNLNCKLCGLVRKSVRAVGNNVGGLGPCSWGSATGGNGASLFEKDILHSITEVLAKRALMSARGLVAWNVGSETMR